MKTLNFFTMALFSAFLLVSCGQKPEGAAETSEAEEVEEVSASASDYMINLDQSEINWNGFKPTGRHYGTIGIQDGQLAVENGKIVGGSFTMDMNNIDVQDLEGEDRQKLTGHLKSEDFFHVEEYPTAEFVITSIEEYQSGAVASAGEDDNMAVVVNEEEVSEFETENPTHTITGNLTMRDTTLSVTFPAHVEMQGDQIMANAKLNIDRTNWNVSYNDEGDPVRVAKDKFIYNTVNVGFDITATKEGEPQAQNENMDNNEDS